MNQLRQQLTVFWKNLKLIQRVVLLSLVLVSVLLVAAFVVWANTPTYAVAFSGLSEADAGLIVEKLTEKGIPYQLRDNTTILVPSSQVYDARLSIAREGLPQGTTVGYEIFDNNTFGMTDFTQRVNYQRALEGELERTIGSMTAIQAVRVHIVIPEKTLLTESASSTTASVIVQEKVGQHLDAAQIRSITYLLSSSVEGLEPERVAVVDVNGNLLASGTGETEESGLSLNDNHRAAESLASTELKNKVQNLLDTSLGPNRSVVQAYVLLDWTQREITTQSYDPNPDSIRSSQVITEHYATVGGSLGGIPGAETNLPEGLTTEISGTETTYYDRSEQTFNYEITQTEMHELVAPGAIDHIALSVLVDGITDTQKLAALRAVVTAAAGINLPRGDTLAVETIDFDHSYSDTLAADLDTERQWETYIRIGEAAALALLLLFIFWYVQRLLTRLQRSALQVWTPIMQPVSALAASSVPALPGASTPQLNEAQMLHSLQSPQAQARIGQPQTATFTAAGESAGHSAAQSNAAAMTPESAAAAQAGAAAAYQSHEDDLTVSPLAPEDERLQRFIERMANENPAGIADIIRQWLKEE